MFTYDSSHFTTNGLERGIWTSGILVSPGLNRTNPLESGAPWLTTGPGPAYQVLAPQVGGPEGTLLPRASMPDRDSMSSPWARFFHYRGKPHGLSLWGRPIGRLILLPRIFAFPIGSYVDPSVTGEQNAFQTHTTGSREPTSQAEEEKCLCLTTLIQPCFPTNSFN